MISAIFSSILSFLLFRSVASLPQDEYSSHGHRPAPDHHGRIRCGGHVPRDKFYGCSSGEICVNDPYQQGCGMACDMPGICTSKSNRCGGFAGFQCAGKCVDDPSDDCDPTNGGADCIGICVTPPDKPYDKPTE